MHLLAFGVGLGFCNSSGTDRGEISVKLGGGAGCKMIIMHVT